MITVFKTTVNRKVMKGIPMKLGSRELIRNINSRLVLETIMNKQPISRAAISKELGLTKATVSAIVQELLLSELIQEIGSDDTSLGRKPILLSLNKKCGYAICVEIGTSVISAMRADLLCEDRVIKQIATPSAGRLSDSVTGLIHSMCPEDQSPYGLVGICLGIHGITKHNEIIFTPYYEIADIPLGSLLSAHFDVPVFVHNEANLSAVGEYAVLSGDHKNIANLSIHSGVGMGLILNGRLYTGHTGRAGEFGHTVIAKGGRRCPCGNRGCLEQYTSERAVLADYAEALNASELKDSDESAAGNTIHSIITRNSAGIPNAAEAPLSAGVPNTAVPDFTQFVSAVRSGNRTAAGILDHFIQNIAIGVSNILNCFDPEILFINSSFIREFPDLPERILAALAGSARRDLTLLPSCLNDTSTLIGGICIVVQNFLGIEHLSLKSLKTDLS